MNIPFINNLNLDNDLKNQICFINLPENFKGQFNYYYKIINYCSFILFMINDLNMDPKYKEEMINVLDDIFQKNFEISHDELIKKFLFIDNNVEVDVKQVEIICKSNYLKNEKDLKIILFNTKCYENYVIDYYKFQNLIIYEYDKYNSIYDIDEDNTNGGLTPESKKRFGEYLLEQLKKNIKDDIPNEFNENSIKINDAIKEEINEILINEEDLNFFDINKDEIDELTKYLSFAREYLSKLDFRDLSTNIIVNIQNYYRNIKNVKKEAFKLLDKTFGAGPIDFQSILDDFNQAKSDLTNFININQNNKVNTKLDYLLRNFLHELLADKSRLSRELKNKSIEKTKKALLDYLKDKRIKMQDEMRKLVDDLSEENIKYGNFHSKLEKIINLFPSLQNFNYNYKYYNSCVKKETMEDCVARLLDQTESDLKADSYFQDFISFCTSVWNNNQYSDIYIGNIENVMNLIDKNEIFSVIYKNIQQYISYNIDQINKLSEKIDKVIVETKERNEICLKYEDLKNYI